MKRVKVAIIGAGTAGLSARREVAKETDDYVVIDDGPLGTTCARVGCMPSKVLIQVANDFHRRHALSEEGIAGGDALSLDTKQALAHVRKLRDRFVRAVRKDMESWEDKLIRKRATFVSSNTLELTANGSEPERLEAERVVIAAGSKPVVPKPWQDFAHRLIDTDAFFELEDLPKRVVVIGLGVIGLELGQALSRLGVEVHGVTLDKRFGGLSDPDVQEAVHEAMGREFPIHLSAVDKLEEEGDRFVVVLKDGTKLETDAALVTMGRRPNIAALGVEALDVTLDDKGVPEVDTGTFQVKGQPWYMAGDVYPMRPVLHEASDEGRIAGHNAVREEQQCFRRRTPLTITFSAPNIAMVGESYDALNERGASFVTGAVSYKGQGRAIVKLEECGLVHVYADRQSGKLLGAELFAPEGEHLAHLLAWALASELTVRQTLSLPFYHPVLEEGLRTALRDAANQVEGERPPLEVLRCADPPVGVQA